MSGEQWSVREIETLRKLKQQGRSYAYIARVLGKSQGAVNAYAMRERQRREEFNKQNSTATLCWKCINAVPNPETGDGCSWSRHLRPVKGWDAEARMYAPGTGSADITWHVNACPEFKEG